MSIDYVMLGRRIANARKISGLSQEALGEMIHVSAKRMSEIEMGKARPTTDMLVDISNALRISPDDLLVDSLPESLFTEDARQHRLPPDCDKRE